MSKYHGPNQTWLPGGPIHPAHPGDRVVIPPHHRARGVERQPPEGFLKPVTLSDAPAHGNATDSFDFKQAAEAHSGRRRRKRALAKERWIAKRYAAWKARQT